MTDIEKRIVDISQRYGIDEIDLSYVVDSEIKGELCDTNVASRFDFKVFSWAKSPADGSSFMVNAKGGTMSDALDNFEKRLKDHLSMIERWKEEKR